LSLAIGRRGQNVRLASKLCGWDIEIMTPEELEEQIERAVIGFTELDGVTEELAQALVEQGYLSYDDLSVIEPDAIAEMGGLTLEQVDLIVEQAEAKAEEAEVAAAEERRRRREQDAQDAKAADAAARAQAESEAAAQAQAEAEAANPAEEEKAAPPAEEEAAEPAVEKILEPVVEQAAADNEPTKNE
jgi:N utilization substance protein A